MSEQDPNGGRMAGMKRCPCGHDVADHNQDAGCQGGGVDLCPCTRSPGQAINAIHFLSPKAIQPGESYTHPTDADPITVVYPTGRHVAVGPGDTVHAPEWPNDPLERES